MRVGSGLWELCCMHSLTLRSLLAVHLQVRKWGEEGPSVPHVLLLAVPCRCGCGNFLPSWILTAQRLNMPNFLGMVFVDITLFAPRPD